MDGTGLRKASPLTRPSGTLSRKGRGGILLLRSQTPGSVALHPGATLLTPLSGAMVNPTFEEPESAIDLDSLLPELATNLPILLSIHNQQSAIPNGFNPQ